MLRAVLTIRVWLYRVNRLRCQGAILMFFTIFVLTNDQCKKRQTCNLKMPQEDAHLKSEEHNFHLFTRVQCFQPDCTCDWVDERKGHLQRQAVQSILSRQPLYERSACWAADYLEAENNLQLVTEFVTLWLTRRLLDWSNINKMGQYWIFCCCFFGGLLTCWFILLPDLKC